MTNQLAGIIISGIFGLIIGSLLNVIILRYDDLKTIINSRSHCPHCKKEIAWFDLVPFFSYIILLGKCRKCKKTISLQYPIVELATGILFAALFWQYGLTLIFFTLLILSAIFIVIFVYDILNCQISDALVWIAIGVWILYLIISFFFFNMTTTELLNSLYGGLVLGGFLALLVLVSREKWMGAGDIKLGFILGAIAFWPFVLLSGFAAFVLGSIVGLILIVLKIKGLKDAVPFAPFLIIGLYVSLFFGSFILSWYLGIIGL